MQPQDEHCEQRHTDFHRESQRNYFSCLIACRLFACCLIACRLIACRFVVGHRNTSRPRSESPKVTATPPRMKACGPSEPALSKRSASKGPRKDAREKRGFSPSLRAAGSE